MAVADTETVESRIRIAREALGLTQEGLAPLVDLRRQTISEYESGNGRVPRGYLSLLAGCFLDYPAMLR